MEIDVERQQKAREYARTRRRISYVSMGIGVLSILIVLGAGLDKWFRDLIQGAGSWLPLLNWQPRTDWFPWQIIVYCVLITILYELLTSPLSYYSGFVLPHRYGISVMSLRAWLREVGIGLGLNLLLEAVFISLVYALLAFQPQLWWLWAALIILFFSVLMANLAPILIFPLFYKFSPLPDGELVQRLLKLAEQANTRVKGVFSMQMSHKTTATNAALMGLGNTRRIVLGDTMTDRYTIDEIEVVLAHELGHHVHRDIWKLIASQTVLMLVGLFLVNLVFHWVVDQQHYYRSLTDAATLPFFFALIGVFSFIIMPLSNGLSRRIEYQADEYALASTHKIEAFKGAMRRLANQNLSELEPAPIVEFLFHSHPSIQKRLQHADEFASRTGYTASASLSAES
ncbi:peptidase [Dictyobacter sp. S3.2.2.5]|uniref:Peptidase n=2 Tax=Dictyobacter halimunensis TaxID=3026934 RepID=A0ABQ6FWL6_9CHLR|nr:peptidase [Dictyobacter sp. S3.2.2.5]